MLRILPTLLASAATLWAGPPNFLLIVSDDQRWDSIGALSGTPLSTPHLDSLAAEGFVFTQARLQGAFNAAVCVPARAMIHSGQNLFRMNESLTGQVTLGELLKAHGYHAHLTGKWHNGDASLRRSFHTGTHITGGFLGNGQDSAYTHRSLANDTLSSFTNNGSHATDQIGQAAEDFLATHSGATPFFLSVNFTAPHDPFTTTAAWREPYLDGQGQSLLPLPPAFLAAPAFDPGVLGIRDELLLPRPLIEADLRTQNTDYQANVRQVDHRVGRILDQLTARGFATNTLVVYTSDNGLARGAHGLLGKQNVYEHSVRIPLLLRGPGIPAGGRHDPPVYLHDLYPTLADYAGVPLPAGQVDGLSLRPLIEGRLPAHRSHAYHAYQNLVRALVADHWKLVEYHVGGTRTTRLYDLSDDPHETVDRSAEPALAPVLARLRTWLLAARDRHGDTGSFWTGSGLGTASADSPVTWTAAAPTTGPDVLLRGPPVFARQGGPSGVTVDGVDFSSLNLGSGFSTNAYSGTLVPTGDPSFDELIRTFTYGGGAGQTPMILSGLVSGQTYRVQLFYNDQRSTSPNRVMRVTDAFGNGVDLPADALPGTQTHDYGTQVVGTFTAAGPRQTLFLQPLGFANSHLNALLVCPAQPLDAAVDSDDDGLADVWEQQAGTDPHDADSRFRWATRQSGDDLWQVAWFGHPGGRYQPWHSPDLQGWHRLSDALSGASRLHTLPLSPTNRVYLGMGFDLRP